MRKIDIIVPCYCNPEQTLSCLQGFDRQSVKDFKVWLCVNGDPTDIKQMLSNASLGYAIQWLSFEDKADHGRAANRNQALKHLDSEYTLYHDSDLKPTETLIEEHLKIVDDKTVSMGMVEYTNRSTNLWAEYQYHTGRAKYSHGAEVPLHYFNTQNVMMPTTILKQLQGQDERLKGYGGDDTELGFRIQKECRGIRAVMNRCAKTLGIMDKTVQEALNDIEDFGKHNFPGIVKKHPDFTNIYKIGRYRNSPLFRFMIHLPVDRLIRYLLFTRSVTLLHLLTVKAVYKGYRQSVNA